MTETWSDDGGRPSNGAVLRVLGGVLVGIGIAPVVVAALTLPVGAALGDEAATLFRFGFHLLAAVFGLVVLHVVRLFYRGTWRSLRDDRERPPSSER